MRAVVTPEISVYIYQNARPQIHVENNLDSVVKRQSYLKTQTFLRTALFWAIMQQVVVIPYEVSGQPISPVFKGPRRWDRWVV
jgi:hypothetical protein